MTEAEWVQLIAKRVAQSTLRRSSALEAKVGLKLPYGHEILAYGESEKSNSIKFETDLTIIEKFKDGSWKPRVVIEAKIRTINTHDAITYSHKAATHKAVHPYLRYGVILGERRTYPLPGRLYRHGEHFDFMMSFVSTRPTETEWKRFSHLLKAEVRASKTMEKIIYQSRHKNRDHYTMLHRKLVIS